MMPRTLLAWLRLKLAFGSYLQMLGLILTNSKLTAQQLALLPDKFTLTLERDSNYWIISTDTDILGHTTMIFEYDCMEQNLSAVPARLAKAIARHKERNDYR